jgi:hypothetical protein
MVRARRNEITLTIGDAERFGLRRLAGFEAFERGGLARGRLA